MASPGLVLTTDELLGKRQTDMQNHAHARYVATGSCHWDCGLFTSAAKNLWDIAWVPCASCVSLYMFPIPSRPLYYV
ncbi:unnamed protein product [Prunus armeniaca]|uniref:Uncharacterized protein n=1 Tax=Prunus armeniaca TaxID=36596 RepID=A0A6J5WVL1_PRUAR|nr:unnamed protein product [Prunus armeniaca]